MAQGPSAARLPHAALPPGFADSQGFPLSTQGATRLRTSECDAGAAGDTWQERRAALHRMLLGQRGDALSDAELLDVLLGLVLPVDPAPLARAVLARFGSFAAAMAAPVRELRGMPGLGTHSIAALKLLHGAALRLARAEVMHQPVLGHWDRLIGYLTAVLARERVEQFRILFLDPADRLLADEAQARGTVNHTPVYPREVVKRALELRAASLILVHNHPSGDPTPSREDLAMTRAVAEALGLLGIRLRDHVIIGNGRWVSFSQEGLLDPSPAPEACPAEQPGRPGKRQPAVTSGRAAALPVA